jgi:hypothetical protein
VTKNGSSRADNANPETEAGGHLWRQHRADGSGIDEGVSVVAIPDPDRPSE